MPRKVSGDLEHSDRTFRDMSPYADPDARLEVGVKLVARDHIQWNGAVGKHDLTGFRIDA